MHMDKLIMGAQGGRKLVVIRLSGAVMRCAVAVGVSRILGRVVDSAPRHIHGDNGIGNVEC